MKGFEFRGKRKDTGEWVKGGSIIHLYDEENPSKFFMPARDDKAVVIQDCHDNIVGFDTHGIFYAIQDDTIGRGMGRTDTDGASIFEGDIIQCGARRYIVCYGDCGGVKNTSHDVGYVGFYFKAIYDDDLWRTDPIYYLNAYSCKVIGNIYDNAELLPMEVNNEDD